MTYSPLARTSAVKEVLRAHNLTPKHALGQNFLVADEVIAKILRFADLSADDGVLEIGPGMGTLTLALLAHVKGLVVVEKDSEIVQILEENVAHFASPSVALDRTSLTFDTSLSPSSARASSSGSKLQIVVGDALDLDYASLAKRLSQEEFSLTKCVSNLPYQIAARVVLHLFQTLPELQRQVVMVQKEVAERMFAAPATKQYSAYTVKLALYAHVADWFSVSRDKFFPAPHVDSAVVLLKRGAQIPEIEAMSFSEKEDVVRFVQAAFSMRRKMMMNALVRTGYNREALDCAFEATSLDTKVRAEQLAPLDFVHLFKAYGSVYQKTYS